MTTPGCRPQRAKEPVETDEYDAFVRRALRAYGRRASEDVDALRLLRDFVLDAEAVLDTAAVACHSNWSWGEIAQRLGVTRQAVQKRWGGHQGDPEPIEEAPCR